MTKIARILVPTDFSSPSEAAIDQALALARPLGAEVTVLNAWSAPPWPMPDGGAIALDPETRAQIERWSAERLAALKAVRAELGVRLETRSIEGEPAETIAHVADDEHFDLVVMGTHGRTGVRHLLLGSVAERVVRTARTPVMTVHAAPLL